MKRNAKRAFEGFTSTESQFVRDSEENFRSPVEKYRRILPYAGILIVDDKLYCAYYEMAVLKETSYVLQQSPGLSL